MTHKSALYFRDAFREARLKVLANAEHYQELLFVLERLGKHLTGKGMGLGGSELAILGLVAKHGTLQGQPAGNLPIQMGTGELDVVELYDLVRRARNDAMHEGAFARNLAVHLVQLSIILEDALVNKAHCKTVKHYMMRHPVCAQPWEPVGFIRQTMLEHSFSFLPVQIKEKWEIVSDRAVSAYLWQQCMGVGGKKKLERPLQEAIKRAVRAGAPVRHPAAPEFEGVTFVTFLGPITRENGIRMARSATVISPGKIDRSPCGTGSSARVAVMHARGELAPEEPFLSRSLLGTEFRMTIAATTEVAGRPAIVPEISGRAWITGEHTFHLDPGDPFPEGYRLSDTWYRAGG